MHEYENTKWGTKRVIDRRKNICYVIHVYYIRKDEECRHKFLSQHSSNSKRFKSFVEHYFKNLFPVSRRKMGGFDGDISSQQTISQKQWQDVKQEVLEGITEQEKCY